MVGTVFLVLIAAIAGLGYAAGAAIRKIPALRRLIRRVRSSFAEARIHRSRIEAELHGNRYALKTKSDDDLPAVL